ncbi:cytoplasmic dynein 1 heavy chain 1-like [Halichondria panicea]|uniref:cytoplasmic dynein 1 heavy chain 1-like n=1 Tax=Halichondria panicea TaxID=6063 RepID=UPI00312BCBBF
MMVTILPPTYQTVTPKPLLHGLCHCEVATVCQGGLDKFVLYPQILKAIIKSCVGHVMESFCNETFDFQAMGRIFVGLCQVIVIIITHVGAWGCFDEFNRLEERMLSAVSYQIQMIQEALKEHGHQAQETLGSGSKPIIVELVGKSVKINQDMAIFITMNPGYTGRSNLPDNLKQLFRSLAMTKPLIARVMLYSQGFRTAEILASKIVPFFKFETRGKTMS